jgi:protein-tyrosine phosphatase
MIDLHIHLLPGIDDGPAEIAGTIELARACVADGVQAVTATPHVSANYPTAPERMAEGVRETRLALAEAGVDLKVYPGAEVAIDRVAGLSDDELLAFTLGPSKAYMLLECPYAAWPMELETQLGRLATLDVRGILAHPERSAGVQAPGGLDRLAFAVERGLLVQVTAGSLAGRFGGSAQDTARTLLERELVHVIASDAHNADRRPPRMAEAAEEVGNAALARWLTVDVPLAVVGGERPPERPEGASPGRKKRRRLFGRA